MVLYQDDPSAWEPKVYQNVFSVFPFLKNCEKFNGFMEKEGLKEISIIHSNGFYLRLFELIFKQGKLFRKITESGVQMKEFQLIDSFFLIVPLIFKKELLPE